MSNYKVKHSQKIMGDHYQRDTDDSVIIEYDENGNISSVYDESVKRYVSYDSSGEIKFEFTPQRTYINGKYCAPFKLGIKNRNHENHWQENTTLDPRRKTIIMLGGKATYNAREANGYLNSVIKTVGISSQQISNVQLVSCYRLNWKFVFNIYLQKTKADFDLDLWEVNFRKREILRKLMPFMANKFEDKWERLPSQELCGNFRNIMLMSHCYGASDLVEISSVLRQTMTKLGYSSDIQKQALKQIICITNNNCREFKDNNGFTTFHRYSVFDGQRCKSYQAENSSDYPVFMEQYLPFHKFDGRHAAFTNINKNEMLMAFDKIFKYGGDEHNDAFFTTDNKMLTHVGRLQAQMFKQMGRFWLQNNQDITNAADFIRKSVQDSLLAKHLDIFMQNGRKLQKAKINPIYNPSIIKVEYKKYNQFSHKEDEHGVYKLLSADAKNAHKQAHGYGCFEQFEHYLYNICSAEKNRSK